MTFVSPSPALKINGSKTVLRSEDFIDSNATLRRKQAFPAPVAASGNHIAAAALELDANKLI